ncbi:MAG: DUF3276 family protein [Bacteroidales bacterium]|nr:DUF3276 family protein [Bacteroidales bacterium]
MIKDEKTIEIKKNDASREVFSKSVKAGKRTYFFDVKRNRKNDLYLTVTESKKRFIGEGTIVFEKHKIFLYEEDFDNFKDALLEILDCVDELTEKESLCSFEIAENRRKEHTQKDFL